MPVIRLFPACLAVLSTICAVADEPGTPHLAGSTRPIHQFSTLLTAQSVRDHLSSEEGIATAIDWCRKTTVTKVYVEVFRETVTRQSGRRSPGPGSDSRRRVLRSRAV